MNWLETLFQIELMIGVDFIGRLGNQMFTYAFARLLLEQRQNKHEPLIANFKRCGDKKDNGWGDSLKYFNVYPYQIEQTDLILKYGTYYQRCLYLLYMACVKLPLIKRNHSLLSSLEIILRKNNIHFTGAADTAYSTELANGSIFCRGYFQDRHFFDAIRSILLEEFTPVSPLMKHNVELYNTINQPNSVCVSVRRGDFLSPLYKKNFYVCTPDYYEKAIKSICMQLEHPSFFFFSDDIEWVRLHMKVEGYPCYYERGDDPAWEILRLMYSCHHFIISNSTFSWWAQYLGRREDKIVISPQRWFANPKWHSNLIHDHFQFIDGCLTE